MASWVMSNVDGTGEIVKLSTAPIVNPPYGKQYSYRGKYIPSDSKELNTSYRTRITAALGSAIGAAIKQKDGSFVIEVRGNIINLINEVTGNLEKEIGGEIIQ